LTIDKLNILVELKQGEGVLARVNCY